MVVITIYRIFTISYKAITERLKIRNWTFTFVVWIKLLSVTILWNCVVHISFKKSDRFWFSFYPLKYLLCASSAEKLIINHSVIVYRLGRIWATKKEWSTISNLHLNCLSNAFFFLYIDLRIILFPFLGIPSLLHVSLNGLYERIQAVTLAILEEVFVTFGHFGWSRYYSRIIRMWLITV